jgi:hypothetical protein
MLEKHFESGNGLSELILADLSFWRGFDKAAKNLWTQLKTWSTVKFMGKIAPQFSTIITG